MVSALLDLACNHGEMVWHEEKEWCSATFSGSRHLVALRFVGTTDVPFGDALIEQLPGAEIELAGHLVVDSQILCTDRIGGVTPETLVVIEFLLLDNVQKEAA